jgi:hypothetical protein
MNSGWSGGHREPRLHARKHLDPLAAAVADLVPPRRHQRLHLDGNPDLLRTRRVHAVEPLRGHAHNRHRVIVHQEFLTDNLGVRGEARHPIIVAQHDRRMTLVDAIVFLRREHPPDGRAHPQGLEEVAGHEFRVDPLRLPAEAEGNIDAAAAEHAGERLGPLLEILVHRVGRHARSPIASYVRPGGPDHDELFGLRHGQEAEHQLIDQGEDGGVGADAKGERGHGN